MLRSILTAWRPIALAALLALAAAPTDVWAAGHGGGFHGGGGGFHGGGFHGGGVHFGGFHAGGYRAGYFSGFHNGSGFERRGNGYTGGYFSPWSYGSPAYISGGYGVTPYYSAPDYTTPAPDNGVSSYYSPGATAPTPAVTATEPPPPPNPTPGPGTIDVHVPASAQVWFDDSLTKQTGDWRRFQTPPMSGDRDHQYEVRAHWTENGRVTEQTRRITVHAYEVTVVDFTQPAPAASASK